MQGSRQLVVDRPEDQSLTHCLAVWPRAAAVIRETLDTLSFACLIPSPGPGFWSVPNAHFTCT